MSITDLSSFLFAQLRHTEEEAGRVYEAVIGVVTDNKDPDKLARVKVKFPTLSKDDNSWWAPLISVGAGKNRGWFFIPEIDDEVLVMFEHGDIAHPVVIGALWNGKDKPPDSNSDGGNKKRTMVSRTGDTIELDDDSGKITIKDGGGKGEIVIDKANKISYTAKMGDALIHSKDDLTIDAKEVTMEASATLDIVSGSGDVKTGSDGKIDLKGQAMVMAKGTQAAINGGSASAPSAPSSSPAEVADPVA
jgi:uncharacterized protein involved in type VI secretion and phage assembly